MHVSSIVYAAASRVVTW